MPAGRKISEHIDEFNKIVLDLAILRSLTTEDVLATLNSRDLKKRTEGTKEETGDGLYVRGRSDHSGKTYSGESSWFKLRGGTGKLKCFICHSEGHLKRDCPMNKSSGFIKKGKHNQDSDSSDDEGNAYFGEALVVVENDEMTELVMDQLGDNRTCTIKGTEKVKIQLHDESSFVVEDVRYVPGLRRSMISLGTLEKNGYTVKMKMGRNKQLGSKQVGFKQLGHKQVGFKQLGPGVEIGVHGVQVEKRAWFEWELQGAQGDREAEVFQVSNDDAAVAQRRLEDKQLEEKTITDCSVKEQEKVHLGIKVGANIMVTGVPGQEGVEGNVVEKKKVKESKKANLGKLLKYNAWSTRILGVNLNIGKEFSIRLRIGFHPLIPINRDEEGC
ncbi:zinc finger, CCHC-type containing protein [Tanacetum coccineum]